ncbi:MAG: porin family protein [Ferruginibacter sp.]
MMKKLSAIALVLALTSSAALAQDFKLGVKAGTDIQKLSGKSFTQEFSYGYHFGAFSEIGITKKWGIQPEVMFSSVNVDSSSDFSSIYKFGNMTRAKLQYLKIPLLLTYKPNPFMVLQVGPQFGILKSSDKNLLQNGQQAFKEGDFSMVGGLQLNVSKFRLYGRYGIGLTNLNDVDNKDKWKSQTVQIGVGFTL